MGRGNRCVDINEVHVCTEPERKEQLMIHLWHMEESFGGVAMQKRERERIQHKVPTNHLADMDGSSVRRCQPRLQYAKARDKYIIESEPINPLVGHEARRKFPTTQVHTILWEVGIKLDISGFQGYLQPKEPLVKKERKVQQKEGA
jgi:hypothetical protein